MCGATHKQFSIFFVYIAVILLNVFSLIDINFYLQVLLMLPMAKSGALFPDVDHTWKNVKEKTTINWLINKFIHLTKGVHRSRHTHSWDICLVSFFILFLTINHLFDINIINELDVSVCKLILVGFYSGWISHLFSDMLSGTGVYLFCFLDTHISFVPKQLLGFKFNTGGAWENFCYNIIRYINFFTGLLVIIYPFFMNPVFREWILSIINEL